MEELLIKYREKLVEYQHLVDNFENRGVENLNYEETEDYGVYKGKVEAYQDIIQDLEFLT